MWYSLPFVPEHLAALFATRGELWAPPVPVASACTIVDAEGPVCCFGLTEVWPGLGLAWCEERDTASMVHHGIRMGLHIRRGWDRWRQARTYRRIECRVPAGHEAAHRLVQWLGFHPLVTKPGYGLKGETVIEYVWYPQE